MITPKFAYLVIFILHNIQCFKHTIELHRCKPIVVAKNGAEDVTSRDAYCFVRDSCFKMKKGVDRTTPGNPNSLTQYGEYDKDELTDGTCEVIMQIKRTALSKWHVMMQVTGQDLDNDFGINFNVGVKQFNCMSEENKLGGALKPKVYDEPADSLIFNQTSMFCSLAIEFSQAPEILPQSVEKPIFQFKSGGDEKNIEVSMKASVFWKLPKSDCPITKVKSGHVVHGDELLHEVDTTLQKFECKVGSRLKIKEKNEFKDVDELYCNEETYHFSKGGDTKVEIDVTQDDASFDVYCAVKFCSLCANLAAKTCSRDDCVLPVYPTDQCGTAICPSGKRFLADDGDLKDTSVMCRQSKKEGQSRTAGWFMGEEEITEAMCTAKYDCAVYSQLDLACSPEHPDCTKPTLSGQMYSCGEGYDMKYNNDNTASNLTCDQNTGKYKAGEVLLERSANVVCLKRSEGGASAQEQGMSTTGKAGIACGVIALGIIILIIVICICRRRKPADRQKSLNHSEGMKTAVPAKSMEGILSATGSKSQSGSEAPPSTDKDTNKMPESSSNEKKEERKEEEKKKDKKEEKKEKTKEEKEKTKEEKEKKKEKKTRTKTEEEEKKEEKKIIRKKVPMDMGKKSVPNLQQVNRELEQMRGNEAVDQRATAPKMDTTDLTIEQMRANSHLKKEIKEWGEDKFQELMLPLVIVMSRNDRVDFIHSVTAFEYHGSPQHTDRGTLTQFFQVVRRCHDKELDCKPTWEIIMRLIKLLCHYIPQKEGADVINRMKTMMRDIGNMLLGIEKIGYVPGNKDPAYQKTRREYALRMLMSFEDPTALEELKKMAEAKPPEDVEQSVQTAVFAYAVNNGKREQLEASLQEELKKTPKEHPKPEDRPYGTLRQHLIYGLCADKNPDGMAKTLAMVTKPWSLKPDDKIGQFNPADWHAAYKGATEHCENFDRVLKWKLSNAQPDGLPEQFEDNYAAYLDEFAKDPDDKEVLNKRLKIDFIEIVVNLVENCTSTADFFKLFHDTGDMTEIFIVHGQRCDYNSEMHMKRAEALEKILKSKSCVESMDEALKKSNY